MDLGPFDSERTIYKDASKILSQITNRRKHEIHDKAFTLGAAFTRVRTCTEVTTTSLYVTNNGHSCDMSIDIREETLYSRHDNSQRAGQALTHSTATHARRLHPSPLSTKNW